MAEFGIAGGRVRLAASVAALATIPLGLEVAASAQVGALAAIVAAALVIEGTSRVTVRLT